EVASVLDSNVEVGQSERDRLEPSDRAAEGFALLGVVERELQACARAAEGQRRDRDPPIVEDGEEVPEPLPGSAEQVLPTHVAVAEDQPMGVARVPAELPVARLDSQT